MRRPCCDGRHARSVPRFPRICKTLVATESAENLASDDHHHHADYDYDDFDHDDDDDDDGGDDEVGRNKECQEPRTW